MLGAREDEGVVDACGVRGGGEEGCVQEGFQWRAAGDVGVEVDAAEVVEEQVAEDVGALDGLWVGEVVGEDVGVVGEDEGCGVVVGPELVVPGWVEGCAALAGGDVFG